MAIEREQREAERFPVNATSVCLSAARVAEELGPVKIKNISTSGIGLVSSKKVDVGAQLAVKLSNPAKNAIKTFMVRVTHVTNQPGGTFLIGGAFDTPLTYEELCIFVM